MGRRGDELLDLLGDGRGRGALPLRRRRQRGAHPPARAHRLPLALLPARRPARAALRLSRPRAVRPGARQALQRRQAADRPVREGDRRPRRMARRERASVRPDRSRRRRPDPRRDGQRCRDPEVDRDRRGVRLGGRRHRAAADAVARDGDLRGAREGVHEAPSRGARGPARHLRRARLGAVDRLLPGPRRHGGRAAACASHRRRELPLRPRPDELLGLQLDRLPRAALALRGDRATGASRCASSRAWSRRCTPPASR